MSSRWRRTYRARDKAEGEEAADGGIYWLVGHTLPEGMRGKVRRYCSELRNANSGLAQNFCAGPKLLPVFQRVCCMEDLVMLKKSVVNCLR